MKSPQQFLLCIDASHAEVVDQFIMERLREIDGSKGSQWSGSYTNGTSFGVLWGSPASSLFGVPITEDPENGDPSVVIETEVFDEEGISNWQPYTPPAPEVDEDKTI